MTTVQIVPWFAAVGVAFTTFIIATRPTEAKLKNAWALPAFLSGLFFAWSLYAILTEGPLAFWTEHTRNRWGNQIFFDLLLAAGIAWSMIVPRAKARGMTILFWLALVLCTGSIGLLAMLSRLLFLEQNSTTRT
jgi:hypothetical protein